MVKYQNFAYKNLDRVEGGFSSNVTHYQSMIDNKVSFHYLFLSLFLLYFKVVEVLSKHAGLWITKDKEIMYSQVNN